VSTYRSIRRLAATGVSEAYAGVEVARGGLPSRRVVVLKRLLCAPVTNAAISRQLPELENRLNQSAFEGLVPVAEVGAAGPTPGWSRRTSRARRCAPCSPPWR
jgi:hypothetical protein